jgi:hypothetical protein
MGGPHTAFASPVVAIALSLRRRDPAAVALCVGVTKPRVTVACMAGESPTLLPHWSGCTACSPMTGGGCFRGRVEARSQDPDGGSVPSRIGCPGPCGRLVIRTRLDVHQGRGVGHGRHTTGGASPCAILRPAVETTWSAQRDPILRGRSKARWFQLNAASVRAAWGPRR